MTIVLEQIGKSYGPLPVLRDLSASLRGHTVLWGPSGCGKTTLARILWGLERPDAGRVVLQPDGGGAFQGPAEPGAARREGGWPAGRRGRAGPALAAVFQQDRLCGQLTAVGNAALVCPGRADEAMIRAEFARLGMTGESLAVPAALLSGGQRRRVALVRAALSGAPGAVLDEPFRGLDAAARDAAMRYVREAFDGKWLLIATHDPAEAAFFGPQRLELPLLAAQR